MENCLFCKIVKGDIPCVKVYEDNEFLAFESINPISKGHTLIVPKEHSKNILEVKEELGVKLLKLTQKIGKACITGLDAKGFNVLNNMNEEAGQSIFHTHIHIIPRYTNDGIKGFKEKEGNQEELILAADKIIKAIE